MLPQKGAGTSGAKHSSKSADLCIVQCPNTTTRINFLTDTISIKYRDQSAINCISRNFNSLKKVRKFTPAIIERKVKKENLEKKDIENENSIISNNFSIDYLPGGSLNDVIRFQKEKLAKPLLDEFNSFKDLFIIYLIDMVEILGNNKLIHAFLTPDSILFTHKQMPVLGGIQFISHITQYSNSFEYFTEYYKNENGKLFTIYLAPELKNGQPHKESMTYSLALIIFSILTMDFVEKVPTKDQINEIKQKYPNAIPENLLYCIIECCNENPDKRKSLNDLKKIFFYSFPDLDDQTYSIEKDYPEENSIFGQKQFIIEQVSFKNPISYFIIGNSFVSGNNMFEVTKKEALSFLRLAKKYSIFTLQCEEMIHVIQHKQAFILPLQTISTSTSSASETTTGETEETSSSIKSSESPLTTSTTKTPSKIDRKDVNEENENIITSNVHKFDCDIIQSVNDPILFRNKLNLLINQLSSDLEIQYDDVLTDSLVLGSNVLEELSNYHLHNSCPAEDYVVDTVSDPTIDEIKEMVNHPTILRYQSLANAIISSREKARSARSRRVKRNINFHSFTQLGFLQATTRLLAELNPEFNYEIFLNVGKGTHSENGESILSQILKDSVPAFSGLQVGQPDNKGVYKLEVVNVRKEDPLKEEID